MSTALTRIARSVVELHEPAASRRAGEVGA